MEKQKVARLIKQAVEREAAIRELEAALAEARTAAAPDTPAAEAERAAALEEQNRALALENTRCGQLVSRWQLMWQLCCLWVLPSTRVACTQLPARQRTADPATPHPSILLPSSLRAKLTHAFDLLRTYQHKVRVLDATVGVAGAASGHSSRPVTPVGQLAASGCSGHGEACTAATACPGVESRLLAQRLESLEGSACSTHCNAAVLSTPTHGSSGTHFHAPGAACCGQLSPVAEGGAEGASPGLASSSAAAAAAAAGERSPAGGVMPAADSSSLQLVQPGAPALPQLETLKMLAQALLEAQAEVAAKQQQQQQQQQQHWGSASTEAPGGQAALAAAGHLPTAMAVPPHAQLVFDASLGPCGGFLINQQPTAGCGSAGQCCGDAAPPSQAHGRQTGIASSNSGSSAEDAHRPPVAVLPPDQTYGLKSSCSGDSGQWGGGAARAAGRCGSGEWSGGCSWVGGSSQRGSGSASLRPLDFGDDLLALVQDVENIGWRHAERGHGRAGAGHASGHWSEHGVGSGAPYEENDVLLILEQL